MKTIFTLALSAGVLVSSPLAICATAGTDTKAMLMAEAKITEAQATTTALAKTPRGTVKSSELEREHGRLVWSFDISQPSQKGVTEIQVDAKTGKIVSMKKESAAQEMKEVRAEEHMAK
jgi:uncharacterized membrane protein YkoI